MTKDQIVILNVNGKDLTIGALFSTEMTNEKSPIPPSLYQRLHKAVVLFEVSNVDMYVADTLDGLHLELISSDPDVIKSYRNTLSNLPDTTVDRQIFSNIMYLNIMLATGCSYLTARDEYFNQVICEGKESEMQRVMCYDCMKPLSTQY